METMKPSRSVVLLLTVIAAAVVVIAAVMIGQLMGPGGESAARKQARHDAENDASSQCYDKFADDPAAIGGPEYKSCIKRATNAAMSDWDDANPDG
jgi:hypothetical protein